MYKQTVSECLQNSTDFSQLFDSMFIYGSFDSKTPYKTQNWFVEFDNKYIEVFSLEDQLFVEKAKSVVNNKMSDENFSIGQFAMEMNISKTGLYRKIKALIGLCPFVFVRSVRINFAKQMLSNTNYNISEIAFKVGFSELRYFSKCFKTQVGLIPKEYRASIQAKLNSLDSPKNDGPFLKMAIKKIENKICDTSLNFNQLAIDLNVSKATLYRKIKSHTGLAPCELISSVRIKHSAELLKESIYNVADIAIACGFNDPKYFSKCFKSEFGITPYKFQLLATAL